MNDLVIQNTQVVSCNVSEELNSKFNCDALSIQLNEREQMAILTNFNADLYDVAAEITWRRTISILRDRLSIFGDEFIGDMLGYDKPISADKISEQEVIQLNSDVGFLRSDAKMELLHNAEQINRYTSREYQMVEKISINKNQAVYLISNCISFVLSDMTEVSMLEFSNIRRQLCSELMSRDSDFVIELTNGEYFEKRTILRSLMNMAHTEKIEEKECVFHNMQVIVPAIWKDLAEKDKYSFGTTYAMISNTDIKDYINAVRTILIAVHGFDYVPENLKSNSFIEVAKQLISVHNGLNNFYNEPLAAKNLASMGTMIPDQAIYDCLNATLICATGNSYGISNEAQPYLQEILNCITAQKWELYLKDMINNEDILYQLAYVGSENTVVRRWCNIINQSPIHDIRFNSKSIDNILKATKENDYKTVRQMAKNMYRALKID